MDGTLYRFCSEKTVLATDVHISVALVHIPVLEMEIPWSSELEIPSIPPHRYLQCWTADVLLLKVTIPRFISDALLTV